MLSINLLPQDEKKLIHFEAISRLTIRIGVVIFLLLLLFTILLLPSYSILVFQDDDIAERLEVEQKSETLYQVRNLESEVTKVNARLQVINNLNQTTLSPIAVMNRLFSKFPPGVTLKSFSFDAVSREIVLEGFSPTRDSYIQFENVLKDDDMFSEVVAPISNLISPISINFSIKLSLRENTP